MGHLGLFSVGNMPRSPEMSVSGRVPYATDRLRFTLHFQRNIALLQSARGREASPADLSSSTSPSSMCKVLAGASATRLPLASCHLA